MKKIETRIKQLFKTDAAFCEAQNYERTDFPSKKKTVIKKIEWLDNFLGPLNLKTKIVDINDIDDEPDLNNP
jgi:hypothetical protein